MFDWLRALFGRSRTLRDDEISTTQSSVYAPGATDDDPSGSDYGGGGGDSGGGGGNGGGT